MSYVADLVPVSPIKPIARYRLKSSSRARSKSSARVPCSRSFALATRAQALRPHSQPTRAYEHTRKLTMDFSRPRDPANYVLGAAFDARASRRLPAAASQRLE